MPNICDFYDVIFSMYFKSSSSSGSHNEHDPAHLHISYKGNEYEIDLNTFKFTIYKGSKIRKKVRKIVLRFVKNHKDELLDMWKSQKIHEIEY